MQKMFSTIITENGGYADLHMHTKLSDGPLSVDELLMLCKRKGLRCISITDHDNLDSYKLAEEPAKEIGLEIIPGIEISAVWQGKDIHILGYFCDPTNLALNMELEDFAKQRIARVKAIIKKLLKILKKILIFALIAASVGYLIYTIIDPHKNDNSNGHFKSIGTVTIQNSVDNSG